jgi:hypothetical protein
MLVVGQSLQFFQLGSTLLAENLTGHDRVSLDAGGVEQPVTGSTAQVFARKKNKKIIFCTETMYLHFCKEFHSFETLRHGVKQCIVAAYLQHLYHS